MLSLIFSQTFALPSNKSGSRFDHWTSNMSFTPSRCCSWFVFFRAVEGGYDNANTSFGVNLMLYVHLTLHLNTLYLLQNWSLAWAIRWKTHCQLKDSTSNVKVSSTAKLCQGECTELQNVPPWFWQCLAQLKRLYANLSATCSSARLWRTNNEITSQQNDIQPSKTRNHEKCSKTCK